MNIADLRAHAHLFDDYTELRVQQNRNVGLTMINGDLVRNARSAQGGVSARVARAGGWGFCSTPEVDGAALERVVGRASTNAKVLAGRSKAGSLQLPATCGNGTFDWKTGASERTQKELIEFLTAIDAHILETYQKLSSRVVVINNLDMQKTLLTSQGAESFSLTPRTLIYIQMTIEADGEPIDLFESYGGLGHFADQFDDPSKLFPTIAEQYEHLVAKASGVYADAGPKTCILDAELAGILAHEAIGHTTEADFVMGGSVAGQYMDKEVAASMVTLVDFAHIALGDACPVPVHIDDEGTEALDCTIIDQGILRNFMHNKESAGHFEAAPTGNARAYQFSDEPLIRMRNTAILPGNSKIEEMIASVEDGYYLMKPGNGQADTTSEFMFAVTLGYEIKNGKLGRGLRDTTISGVAFDMLKTVSMLSDEMAWTGAGMCGKKQPIPVGMGGPALKCTVNLGGK
ncbi:MAG: TldD/PmbA family protein [bacterium]|nr:TldD/PmbA family protein [bacterium]